MAPGALALAIEFLVWLACVGKKLLVRIIARLNPLMPTDVPKLVFLMLTS